MNLPEFSVRHSIFGNMLTIFVIVGGLIMLTFLQRERFPEVELDRLVITAAYPNASPEEVEDLITNPIEEKLREIEDIEKFSSSSVEGLSVVTVHIDPEAKYKERVINDIQQKVDQAEIPEEAEEPEVSHVSAQSPIIKLCLNGSVPERELRAYGDYLKDRLEEIPGVSTVTKDGWRDEEFWVEVDLNTINKQELSLTDITRRLALRNVNRPGGKVPSGEQEILLRTVGQFYSAKEIEDVIVRSNTDGNHIRVRDIATVRRAFEKDTLFTRVNNQLALVLSIKKKKSGDTIIICDEVKRIVEEEKTLAPGNINLVLIDDKSFYIKRRLKVLSSNGIIGMIIVIVILFYFLNFRVACITGIGIPFAFLAALMVMSLLGITINLITMFGLIIVLGMLVDDAIIVGENIFRHIEEGAETRSAAIHGTAEVMSPVTATVLTTMAAFLPLVFAPGVWGQILRWMPIVVSITLVASLCEVFLVMPCHFADFIPSLKRSKKSASSPTGHAIMKKIQQIYMFQLHGLLKWRYLFLPLVLGVFVGMMVIAKQHMKVDIFPGDLIDAFVVRLTTPPGTSLEKTGALTMEMEKYIRALPEHELENTVSYIGGLSSQRGGYKGRGSHYASCVVYLTPQNTRERKTDAIVNQLRKEISAIPGIEKLEFQLHKPGPPIGDPLEVKIKGPAFDTLQTIATDIMNFLKNYEGVYDVQQDFEPGKDEVHIAIDYQEAARLGVDTKTIAQTIYTCFQGAESTTIREGNEEIKVRVWLQEPFRNEVTTLKNLFVPSRSGRLIPLSQVARFEESPGRPVVFHYNGHRVITISASFSESLSSTEVNQALAKEFKELPLEHPGYDIIREGEWKKTQELISFFVKAFSMVLLLIYIILSVQFNSFAQPFVVMASIPLGMIGVIIALNVHAKPISIMAIMGMIGLVGVVVNDAIVLVKFINDQRRNHNRPVFDALVLAGQRRLRPILLTSVTTIAGLIPVIYGWGGYEPFIAPAAISLAYGLLFATFLTLLVVPAVYLVGYDIKYKLCKIFFNTPKR